MLLIRWTMADWKKNIIDNDSSLLVSNANVNIPSGVMCLDRFVGAEEEARLINVIDDDKYAWQGFDQRRRVQQFDLDTGTENGVGSELKHNLAQLRQRLQEATSYQFSHASMEEYAPETFSDSPNCIVTGFESSCCGQADCEKCCIVLIPLQHDALAHWNRPKKQRQAMCWTLLTPEHQTNVLMRRGAAYVRSGDSLHLWRSRLAGIGGKNGLFIKFYTPHEVSDETSAEDDTFGYIAQNAGPAPSEPMPAMEEAMTIIVTTSPIKSNPSTELLEKVFETFRFAGDSFSLKCRKIIVCDGCRTQDGSNESVSRRHNNIKQAMRSGIVTTEQAENYQQFKANLKKLCNGASSDSPFYNTVVEELEERHGFGYALRHVLRSLIVTDYVCVIQHDRTFMRPTPIEDTLRAMWNNPGIKYVGCSMRSNLFYKDIFLSKYGRVYGNDYDSMILRPAELLLDASLYGPDSESCRMGLAANPHLRDNLLALADKYRGTSQCLDQRMWTGNALLDKRSHQLTLSPTLFWYDNIHLAETRHYRDFIFHSSYKMVARGGFVEEGVLPVLKKSLDRLGLIKGHERFGCYLLDDHSGFFFSGHLDGGNFVPEALRYENCKDK